MTRGIYRIRCMISKKSYIGRAESIEGRFTEEHLPSLRKGCHHCKYLQRAWDKYGEGSFELEVVLEVLEGDLITIEQSFLNELYPTGTLFNVNKQAVGGSSKGVRSKESRQKTGDKLRGRNLSQEHKEKLRQKALKRGPVSEEVRQKISDRLSEKIRGGWKRQPLSKEAREHLSQIRKGVKSGPMSLQTREKISRAKRGKKTGPVSEERREQMRQTSLGRKLTPEQREKVRQSKLEYWRRKREEKRD